MKIKYRGIKPSALIGSGGKGQGKALTGFTLIELLVVVAIIGVLATVVIINVSQAKHKSNYARVFGDMTSIATAVKAYSVGNNNIYPDDALSNAMPSETGFSSYLPGGWPLTPCGSAAKYRYDYQNWGKTLCSGADDDTDRAIGISFLKVATPVQYTYTLDIKDLLTTCGPSGSIATYAGPDIKTLATKKITCNE